MLIHTYFPTQFAFLVIIFSCFISPYYACNQLSRESLLAISLNFSPPPSIPLNWSSLDCCLWEGIVCNSNGWVTHLWLPYRGLRGGISPFLSNLTHLTHLNLSHNSFTGPLPQGFFSSLNRLEILDLSFNSLLGELPSSLSSNNSLVSIQIMDLSSNQFHGTIQSSFLQLAWNLLNLNVSNNSFAGFVPSSICINSSLVRLLDFSNNNFHGQILRGLGECSRLEVFHAGFNSLSRQLPDDIYNSLALREISLPSNMLSGPIGNGIVRLTNLTILELYGNELNGMLPRDIGKLSNLEMLLLHMNKLSGTIPTSLMNCTNLKKLTLLSNFLEGEISSLNFSKLLQLNTLDLGENNFTGQLPMSLYSCKSLRALRLAYNSLEGQISPEILALQSLSFLSLTGTRLTNISRTIRILMGCKNLRILQLSMNFFNEIMPDDDNIVNSTGLQNLRYLTLVGCQLIGQFPTWLAKLRMLEVLNLSRNQLRGSIPGWLGNFPHLFHIVLRDNLFSGEFPQELTKLPALTNEQAAAQVDHTYLDLPIISVNNFSGSHNAPTGQYNRISNLHPVIDLSKNMLSGNIPLKIGQLKFLHGLFLNHNNFSGNIPEQISNLCNLEELDLSYNHLSGEIPQSMGSLNFLSFFNVSFNNLQGPIPGGTQLQSFGASAYEGNLKLCGSPLLHECPLVSVHENKDIQGEEDGHGSLWFYVSIGLGYITGFWAVLGTLLLKSSWRHAYFQFLMNMKDRLYMTLVAVYTARMERRLQSLPNSRFLTDTNDPLYMTLYS